MKRAFTLVEVLVSLIILLTVGSMLLSIFNIKSRNMLIATVHEHLNSTCNVIGNYLSSYPKELPEDSGYPFKGALTSKLLGFADNYNWETGTTLNNPDIPYLPVILDQNGNWCYYMDNNNELNVVTHTVPNVTDKAAVREYAKYQDSLFYTRQNPLLLYIGGKKPTVSKDAELPYRLFVYQEYKALVVSITNLGSESQLTVLVNSSNIPILEGQMYSIVGASGTFEVTKVNGTLITVRNIADNTGILPPTSGIVILKDNVATPIITYRVRAQLQDNDITGQTTLASELLKAGLLRTENIYQR